jgi:hypothetical protein
MGDLTLDESLDGPGGAAGAGVAAYTRVSRRVIACLDVRSNDEGDLVVTKGDQYDVREPVRALFFSSLTLVRTIYLVIGWCRFASCFGEGAGGGVGRLRGDGWASLPVSDRLHVMSPSPLFDPLASARH